MPHWFLSSCDRLENFLHWVAMKFLFVLPFGHRFENQLRVSECPPNKWRMIPKSIVPVQSCRSLLPLYIFGKSLALMAHWAYDLTTTLYQDSIDVGGPIRPQLPGYDSARTNRTLTSGKLRIARLCGECAYRASCWPPTTKTGCCCAGTRAREARAIAVWAGSQRTSAMLFSLLLFLSTYGLEEAGGI